MKVPFTKKIAAEAEDAAETAVTWVKRHDRPIASVSLRATGELLCGKKHRKMAWGCHCQIGMVGMILFAMLFIGMLCCALMPKRR